MLSKPLLRGKIKEECYATILSLYIHDLTFKRNLTDQGCQRKLMFSRHESQREINVSDV